MNWFCLIDGASKILKGIAFWHCNNERIAPHPYGYDVCDLCMINNVNNKRILNKPSIRNSKNNISIRKGYNAMVNGYLRKLNNNQYRTTLYHDISMIICKYMSMASHSTQDHFQTGELSMTISREPGYNDGELSISLSSVNLLHHYQTPQEGLDVMHYYPTPCII